MVMLFLKLRLATVSCHYFVIRSFAT